MRERREGVGTGRTADGRHDREDAPQEGGSGVGGAPRTADPTGTGRPRLDDHDLDAEDV